MDLLPLAENLYTLMVGGWDGFMSMNPEPPQWDVVGSAAAANDEDLFVVLIGLIVSSRLLWPWINGRILEAEDLDRLFYNPVSKYSCAFEDGQRSGVYWGPSVHYCSP